MLQISVYQTVSFDKDGQNPKGQANYTNFTLKSDAADLLRTGSAS
jgi:hypothetical protein